MNTPDLHRLTYGCPNYSLDPAATVRLDGFDLKGVRRVVIESRYDDAVEVTITLVVEGIDQP